MIQRRKQLLLQLRSADPSASADLSEQTLLKLEVACLAHGEASALQSCVQSVLQRSEPFSLYLELFYLLQQQHCALPEPKKECLRRALQMLIQQPAYALDSVLEIIHGLIEISESRREEFHWAEQLLQIAKMRAEPSLTDMYRRGAGFTARLQEEFSYVAARIWNCGVYYQRLNQLQEAERFMSLSMQLNGFCGDFLSVAEKGEGSW